MGRQQSMDGGRPASVSEYDSRRSNGSNNVYDQPIKGRGERVAIAEQVREGGPGGYGYAPGQGGMADGYGVVGGRGAGDADRGRIYQTDYTRTHIAGDRGSPTGGSSLLRDNVTTQEVS